MITMQSNEVKAGLAEVLRKVEAGQEVAITRHGTVVAYMMPVNRRRSRAAEAVAKIRRLRALVLQAGEEVGELAAEWKAEGRR